jgi:hypothetical protein
MSTAIFIFALFGVACLARPNDGNLLSSPKVLSYNRHWRPFIQQDLIEPALKLKINRLVTQLIERESAHSYGVSPFLCY